MKARGKGPKFERLACRLLSLWVSDGKRDDLFWRTAMSGGRATLRLAKGVMTRAIGDICATDPEGFKLTDHYLIECKHHRDLNLLAFMFGKGKLFKFWIETVEEAASHKRQPMLIAKQNNFPTLLLVMGSRMLGTPVVNLTMFGECPPVVCVCVYYFDDVIKRKFVL
jgi:hypothetical protein